MTGAKGSFEARLVGCAITLFGVGASLAVFFVFASYGRLLEHVTSNVMDRATRDLLVLSMAGAGLVFAALPIAYAAHRGFSEQALARLLKLSRLLSPLLLVFPLPVLFDYHWTQRNEWAFVLAATLFGLGLERSLRGSFEVIDWAPARAYFARALRRSPRVWARAPFAVVCAMAIFVGGYFSYFTVLNHYRLGTMSWDLAIFDNLMWNLIRGSWFFASPDLGRSGSHIQFHANFIAYLFAPFYALYQRAESLLVMQSILVAAAAFPFYLLAKHKLGSAWGAVVIVYAYLVHAPMHAPTFYDFHFLTTAPFWVGWILYFYETQRRGWLTLFFILGLLLREDVSAGLAAFGLFQLFSGHRPRWALVIGIVSAVYFVVVKFVIMPLHRTWSDVHSFTWMFQTLIPPGESGFSGVLRTLVSNPIFTFNSLLELDKLTYIIKMFGPVLLLPLRHPKTWILFIPPAMFTLLSAGYKPLYQTFFQYTSNYTPYVFYSAIIALAHFRDQDAALGLRRYRAEAGLVAIFFAATIFSYSHGALFQRNTFQGGFRRIEFKISPEDRKRHDELYELIAMIPKDASVAATEVEAPHVSARKFCFTMRFNHDNADYLLINIDEAQGGATKNQVAAALATNLYGFVAQRGRVQLWKRNGSQEKNAEGRKALRY